MKTLLTAALTLVLYAQAPAAVADDAKASGDDFKDKILGVWQGAKGLFRAKDTLRFKKYEAFKPGTAGDYSFGEIRTTDPSGRKIKPADFLVGNGSYSVEGNKLTFNPGAYPGQIGKQKVVWEILKATGDKLVLKTDKGKTEEFTRKADAAPAKKPAK